MTITSLRERIQEHGLIPRKYRNILALATSVVEKIPGRNDTIPQIVVKLLSISDSVDNLFESKQTELSVIVDRLGLVTTNNSVFVSMFFGTKINEDFELKRYTLDGHNVCEAVSKVHGTIVFIENYEDNFSPTVYHSKTLDFAALLDRTWDLYEGKLQFEMSWAKSSYSTFSMIPNPLYGSDQQKMEALVAKHRRYVANGKSRTYMIYGRPGTGKSSFALAFADRLGTRILRIDAQSFARVSVSDVVFIIEALRPEFIMVDDVDKAE